MIEKTQDKQQAEPEPTRDAWELESDFEHRLNAWHKERREAKADSSEPRVQPFTDEQIDLALDAAKVYEIEDVPVEYDRLVWRTCETFHGITSSTKEADHG